MDEGDIISGCMPEVPGSKYCPVKSFESYVNHLSPMMDNLWQYPKTIEEAHGSNVWYKNKKIGPNPLAAFMSRMSHDADLSKLYTNHSIWVTGTTFFLRNKFSPKQVMAITGHKSLNSLTIYQKVSTDEKLAMGFSMNYYLQADTINNFVQEQQNPAPIQSSKAITLAAHPTIEANIEPKQGTSANPNLAVVPFESEDPLLDSPDFNLDEILETIENQNTVQTQEVEANSVTRKTTSIVQRQMTKRSPQIPLFNNCTIGTLNITINKWIYLWNFPSLKTFCKKNIVHNYLWKIYFYLLNVTEQFIIVSYINVFSFQIFVFKKFYHLTKMFYCVTCSFQFE